MICVQKFNEIQELNCKMYVCQHLLSDTFIKSLLRHFRKQRRVPLMTEVLHLLDLWENVPATSS